MPVQVHSILDTEYTAYTYTNTFNIAGLYI